MVYDALIESDIDPAPPRSAADTTPELPERIGTRYEIETLLGKGGMAAVYRAKDALSGRRIALKQLSVLGPQSKQLEVAAWFEREFHTLAELSHPRVIAVYDYGVDQGRPYYTMELLDGGDLTELSPLPWREACRVMFDVCSSLALLHSRRLLHRDVSPRNVRCTADGHAKLIDFGAMAPMGYCRQAVGTPAFVAPEVVHRLALDARTDLYSAGATLYYALTGRLPHMARSFAEAILAWRDKPVPPSAHAPETPPALDALVLSLLSVDAPQRPRTANDVMERLAGLAGLPKGAPLSVSRAYLASPALVGRAQALSQIKARLEAARAGCGSALMIQGEPGLGRSRLLDACVLEAKTAGAHVLRANVRAAVCGEFALLQSLVDELLDAVPEAEEQLAHEPALAKLSAQPTDADGRRSRINALGIGKAELQAAVQRWFEAVARREPLAIMVDDVHASDPASLAFLGALANAVGQQRFLIVLTAERNELAVAKGALQVLNVACTPLALAPLDARETEALVSSVFGDVPNLALVTARVYASAGGNPRDCLDLLQHLSSTGQIVYERGHWTLPSMFTGLDLPSSAEGAFMRRLGSLSALARRLLEAQALASHSAFRREDYALIEAASAAQLEAALAELVAEQMLESDGTTYVLARPAFGSTLAARVTPEDAGVRQRGLARVYERAKLDIVAAKHWLAAGEHQPGLAALIRFSKRTEDTVDAINQSNLSVNEVATVFERGLEVVEAHGGVTRFERAEILHWLVMLGTSADDRHYHRAASAWFAEVARDSGYARWRESAEVADAGQRLMAALAHADQQYKATPESERVYAPLGAIQFLVHYVAASLALGVRSNDGKLLASLPEILAPFAPLSPLIHAVWQNAVASYELTCQLKFESACERYRDVLQRIPPSPEDENATRMIRAAMTCGLGLLEARFGLGRAETYVKQLDREQGAGALDAMYLRKVLRLCQGDFEGAEKYRRAAELLAVHERSRPMLEATAGVELTTHALANDLTGVRQLKDRITDLAARYPGWRTFGHLAEAQLQRMCSNHAQAALEFERVIALSHYDPNEPTRSLLPWPAAVSGYMESLCELGRAQEAERCGEEALGVCRELGSALAAQSITRSLALAHAKRGDLGLAAQRLDGLISDQRALGVTGLQLGATLEARTRVAIWAGDTQAAGNFGRLTAAEYRHGTSSALAARYERLMDEAARPGMTTQLPSLTEVRSTAEEGDHTQVWPEQDE